MDHIQSITQAAEDYIQALYQGDVEALHDLFAESAHLYTPDGSDLIEMPRTEYIEMVAARPSPQVDGHPRSGHVLSIDTISTDKAIVKLAVAVPPKQFTDFLLMIRVDESWRIVSKVYHVEQPG